VRCRRVPERNRREVRERRPVVADAVHNSDLAVVVKALHAAHRLIPAELRVDLEDVRLLDADPGPVLVVERVPVGDYGVQAVVTAEPFEDNENFVALIRSNAAACLGQYRWHTADATEQAETDTASAKAQHVPTGNVDFVPRILRGHEASPPLRNVGSIP